LNGDERSREEPHRRDAAAPKAPRRDGLVVVYEDIPQSWWDRAVCFSHNLQWRGRTGSCTFHLPSQWRCLFEDAGFQILTERPLSRWRNLTHPVCRRFYLLTLKDAEIVS